MSKEQALQLVQQLLALPATATSMASTISKEVHAQLASSSGNVDLSKFMGQQQRKPRVQPREKPARTAAAKPSGLHNLQAELQKKKGALAKVSRRVLKAAPQSTGSGTGLRSVLQNGFAKMNLSHEDTMHEGEQDWTISS